MSLNAVAAMLFVLATGAGATGFTPQTDRSSSLITTVRCTQKQCYTYEQWARPGFDRTKERPLAGRDKVDAPKERALNDCLHTHRSSYCINKIYR